MQTTTSNAPESRDKGFTLIELLVVVLIIGVLAAIAIPVFLNQREKAADASSQSDLKNAATLMETWYVDNQDYTDADLTSLGYKPSSKVHLVIEAADTDAYCLSAYSDNGRDDLFYYDSDGGGLTDADCNATSTETP